MSSPSLIAAPVNSGPPAVLVAFPNPVLAVALPLTTTNVVAVAEAVLVMISEVALDTTDASDDAVDDTDAETLLAIECSADMMEERYEATAELAELGRELLMLVMMLGTTTTVAVELSTGVEVLA